MSGRIFEDPVTVANAQVSIVAVCQMFGVEIHGDIETARSRKMRCPFGELFHSDGGVDPSMRIYPESNHAYCFACNSYLTPVSLMARMLDVGHRHAARQLLDRFDIRPMSSARVFEQAQAYVPRPDTSMLAHALKTYCRRVHSDWDSLQFDKQVAAALNGCLSVLDLVRDDAGAEYWLECSKTVMAAALHSVRGSVS